MTTTSPSERSTVSHVIEHDLPLWAACRRTDPVTSRIAAGKAGRLRADHKRKIVEALKISPAGASEIAERVGLITYQVCKRTGELETDGLIELTGRRVMSASNSLEREWRLRT
jgi:hypothetical protein